MRTNLLSVDTRFTFFQAPVKVEDALGRVFPFPSECSISALNAEIKERFKEGPGKFEVSAGDYEVFNAKNSNQVLTNASGVQLLPGMSVYMAIIVAKQHSKEDECQIPHCNSRTFLETPGGGKNW